MFLFFCFSGLGRNGKLVVLGAPLDAIPVFPHHIISQRKSIVGWPSGTNRDSQVRWLDIFCSVDKKNKSKIQGKALYTCPLETMEVEGLGWTY